MKVAFLGLGNMGAPMARNLVKADHQVTVWNRTRERAMEVSGAGAANTPAEAAKDAEVAFTMLADDQATEMVVYGENGLLQGLPKGAIHISSSTISVELSRRTRCSSRWKQLSTFLMFLRRRQPRKIALRIGWQTGWPLVSKLSADFSTSW
jgi:3-hydroxyisobutyrate dehydrogenase-like beta-hydroxyacid dehydrogenase